jgi:biopolymer transport protein ExbB
MIEIFGSQGAQGPVWCLAWVTRPSWPKALIALTTQPADRGDSSLIFWRYFRARVDDYLLNLESAAERLRATAEPAQAVKS